MLSGHFQLMTRHDIFCNESRALKIDRRQWCLSGTTDVLWVSKLWKLILEHVDILKQSYADETENVIDRVSKIHTRENMRLRRKLTKENKKSLAVMDENTHLRRELRKNEIDNSIFLGKLFSLASMEPWFSDFRFCFTWLDPSFGWSIFGSLLRAKNFYPWDYQESFKSQ